MYWITIPIIIIKMIWCVRCTSYHLNEMNGWCFQANVLGIYLQWEFRIQNSSENWIWIESKPLAGIWYFDCKSHKPMCFRNECKCPIINDDYLMMKCTRQNYLNDDPISFNNAYRCRWNVKCAMNILSINSEWNDDWIKWFLLCSALLFQYNFKAETMEFENSESRIYPNMYFTQINYNHVFVLIPFFDCIHLTNHGKRHLFTRAWFMYAMDGNW